MNAMNTTDKLFEICSLTFEQNDLDVIVKGMITHGHMSYSTDVLISQTGLNRLLNELYRQNDGCDIHGMFTSEQIGLSETMYSASFTELANRQIQLEKILFNLYSCCVYY